MKVTESFRKDLDWAIRYAVMQECKTSKTLNESAQQTALNFAKNEASTNQLLNLVYNAEGEVIKEDGVLEVLALNHMSRILDESAFSEILEGALDLGTEEQVQESTDLTTVDGKMNLLQCVIENKVSDLAKKGWSAAKKEAGKQKTAIKYTFDKGKKALKDRMSEFKDKGIGRKKAVKNMAKSAGKLMNSASIGTKIAGGLALATAAALIYKRFFSKAAKACKGASDKSACLKKYKVDAIKATITNLKKANTECSSNKNPEKCKARVAKQVAKWEKKLKAAQG